MKVRISEKGRKLLDNHKLAEQLVKALNENRTAFHYGEIIKFGNGYTARSVTAKPDHTYTPSQ